MRLASRGPGTLESSCYCSSAEGASEGSSVVPSSKHCCWDGFIKSSLPGKLCRHLKLKVWHALLSPTNPRGFGQRLTIVVKASLELLQSPSLATNSVSPCLLHSGITCMCYQAPLLVYFLRSFTERIYSILKCLWMTWLWVPQPESAEPQPKLTLFF